MNGAPRVVIVTINNDEYLYSRVATDSVLASNNRLTRRGPNRDFIDRPPLISAAELDQYEHRVIDTFPLTLADLIPDGCTEFQFKNQTHRDRVAMQHPDGQWEVTGMHGEWQDLNALAFDCAVDLDTVIPLQVSDQYVEERR